MKPKIDAAVRVLVFILIACFLFAAVKDVFNVAWGTGVTIGLFGPRWAVIFGTFTLLGLGLLVLTGILLWNLRSLDPVARWTINRREQMGHWRWIPVLIFSVLPAVIFHYSANRDMYRGDFWLLLNYLLLIAILAIFITRDESRLISLRAAFLATTLLATSFYFASVFVRVSDYPFSLYWSEGNRNYDNSLVFGQNLYDTSFDSTHPLGSQMRYVVWGLPYLIPGLPIIIHRAWDAILWTLPLLLVGWLLFRRINDKTVRWAMAFWTVLFLHQGPTYPHLAIPTAIVLLGLEVNNIFVRGLILAFASVIAGFGRFNWAIGPGTWGALHDLFTGYVRRAGPWIRRLWPVAVIALIGVVPGFLATWVPFLTNVSGLTFEQPMLWYRLWPNPTYKLGIFPSAIVASGAPLVVIFWLILSHRWKMDWIQGVSVMGSLISLFGAGIYISVKIGGGNNLHNFDLYFFSLLLVVSLAIGDARHNPTFAIKQWPRLVQSLLVLAVVIPSYAALGERASFKIAPPELTDSTLNEVRDYVQKFQEDGPVLFIDQRQLITFGYIQVSPFIPDYEKKYMMDQAMAGNREYFQQYYRDLASRKFSLIVSEPLHETYFDEQGHYFGEENNAWVTWVSNPTLCFYKPVREVKKVGIMLLVPNDDISACQKYLDPQ